MRMLLGDSGVGLSFEPGFLVDRVHAARLWTHTLQHQAIQSAK